MNIAIVLPYLSDRFGGPVTVAKHTGRVLYDLGHDVSYWAASAAQDRAKLPSGSRVHVYDVNWPRHWRRSSDLTRALSVAVPNTDILQIHSVWMHTSYTAARIACAADVPYIIRPAGTLQPWAIQTGPVKRLKKTAYLHLVAKSVMARSACVQAASTQEAEQVKSLGHTGPVTVVPNGVNVEEFAREEPGAAEDHWPDLRDKLVLAFMSRLSPEKGLDMLIPVWADLVRSGMGRDAVLVLAGPDHRGYQKVVEAMVESYGLQKYVVLPGMLQGARKLALLRRADAFVLPSYSENFGIVVAEALACGTPVITTTRTPWEQLPQVDAGRWVPPTRAAIRGAMCELLSMSESQRRQMGARGAALIREQYTWDLAARKLLTVCECILQGKSIPLHPVPKEVEEVQA